MPLDLIFAADDDDADDDDSDLTALYCFVATAMGETKMEN